MPTLTPLSGRLGATAVLLLTTVACGGGHGYTPDELDAMIADSVRASDTDAAPTAPPETVFDPGLLLCVPAVDTAEVPGEGAWRTEAPRADVEEGPVELGILPPDDVDPAPVTVTVRTPDDDVHTLETDTAPGEWSHVRYPEQGEGGPPPGVYTVLWSESTTGTPLTCDGFEM
ncbi:hypothetical protein [Nocardiopsis lambiniae]|uniref:Secreted protein n=1 Tax=Nocardiopsis lambiniae TaxID=3075539 RepID=A0ABU2MFX7_9ACTN|nr:hypothetical protein [Nocardiopsis sp. DSM 44743]MDT0331605.1 hypothetical protein [Nocardiopsis sp. DSM 44743]